MSSSEDNDLSPAEDNPLSPAEDNDDLSPAEDNNDLERILEPEVENTETAEQANNDGETNENQEEEDKKEAKTKKVRNPQPKLNGERLRGARGLTMIEKVFKDVKFKGRGHEEEDLGLLMKNFEYWCHRLFPKYPFADCLEKLERLGSKKEVQTYVKRIRMDLIFDEQLDQLIVNQNDSDAEEDANMQNNAFDDLMPEVSQPTSASQPASTAPPADLTEEQLERININRERAQRLRQQMLIRNRDKARTDILNDSLAAPVVQQVESDTTLSQSSSFSDVLKQVDFTEAMSIDSDSSRPPPEAMSVETIAVSSQENMSVGSETFVSQMSVAPEALPLHRQTSAEPMSISSSQASNGNEVTDSQIVPSDVPSVSNLVSDEPGDSEVIQLYENGAKSNLEINTPDDSQVVQLYDDAKSSSGSQVSLPSEVLLPSHESEGSGDLFTADEGGNLLGLTEDESRMVPGQFSQKTCEDQPNSDNALSMDVDS